MAETYEQKRHLAVTPEPAWSGEKNVSPGGELTFVIQRHAAFMPGLGPSHYCQPFGHESSFLAIYVTDEFFSPELFSLLP